MAKRVEEAGRESVMGSEQCAPFTYGKWSGPLVVKANVRSNKINYGVFGVLEDFQVAGGNIFAKRELVRSCFHLAIQ